MRFISIFEDGSAQFYKGEIPQEVLSASDDGLYDLFDITNPDQPLQYMLEVWTTMEESTC